MENSKKALFLAAAGAAACTMAMPGTMFSLAARLLVSGLAGFAIISGVKAYRPTRSLGSHLAHPDPWSYLVAAIAIGAGADVCRTFGGAGDPAFVVAVLNIIAVVLTVLSLGEMLRQRFGDRSLDHFFEAIIAAGTISMFTWIAVVEPVLANASLAQNKGVSAAIGFTVPLILSCLALHMMTSFERRQPSFLSLSASQLIPAISVILAFVGDNGGNGGLGHLAAGLPTFSLAFLGIAALEPSMALYEEPSGPSGARLGRWRLTTLVAPVILGPLVLTLSIMGTVAVSPLAISTYTICLSVLVVGHLISMVQSRASSTHWASHDKLTGLPNRSMFRERCAQALERSRKMGHSVGILYLDLDRFKTINDSMGHDAGDQLLEQVARRILTCVDQGDTVARLGGDEFAILLPSIDDDEVPRKLARRLLKNFAAPFNLKPRPVFMSPSIGISISDEALALETILTQADTAMYRAKESGRNNFAVWSQEMNEASKQRLMLETHLHSAIQNDELRLLYQPKVHLATGTIMGVEALIRWHHPKLGVISPVVFIHLAEESGLINQIGEWVLDTACAQARSWYDMGFTQLTMAVNLSSRQFQQQRVPDLVSAALRKARLAPHLLELELTEGVAMSGDEATLTTLHELREMEVRTSIDDFGTGYSNLSYLSRFPIHNLKIDKSFIEKIDKSGGDAAIVTAIIAMAHGLGLNVIAEGVETTEQARFLVENECDEMQGYLFSRPVPAEQIEALLMLEHAANGRGHRIDSHARRNVERSIPDRERIATRERQSAG